MAAPVREVLLVFAIAVSVHSLSCYTGFKLIRGQSVGQQTEECPQGASCYNMTSSAAFVVDAVKAGCSTWRCMVAQDRCIGININFVPVSLCCCSSDRCNVHGNPQYQSIGNGGGEGGYGGGGYGGGGSGSGGSGGGGYGGGGYGGGDSGSGGSGGGGGYGGGSSGSAGYGGGGYGGGQEKNSGNKNNQGGYGQGGYGGYGGGGGGYGSGGYGGGDETPAEKQSADISLSPNVRGSGGANKETKKWSKKEIEDTLRTFDIDDRTHNAHQAEKDVEEETFQKIDVTKTTPRPARNRGSDASTSKKRTDGRGSEINL